MASNEIKNRKTNDIIKIKEDKTTLFLYETLIGRMIAKILSLRFISVFAGLMLNSRISVLWINNFIAKNQINMDDYAKVKYKSFNDFFTRKIIPGNRPVNKNKNILISPCDAKLIVYKINEESNFKIKNSYYRVKDLILNDLADNYLNGYALIFRLCVDDYHRYSYIDSGSQENNHRIKGKLHTVRPIVLKHYNIYKQNCRQWTILHTDNFDEVIEVEVGAMMVGKIVNLNESYHFKKGEEKGYFEFGGSTIVLLIKEGIINLDQDILDNSKLNIETIVKLGEQIGKKEIR